MTIIFDSKPIPNRLTARRVHAELRAQGASHFEMGQFYRTMLARRLWPTQKAMATFLDVSDSSLSRVLALTKIPEKVVAALGGPNRITFRVGELLLDAIEKIGEATMIARAKEALLLGYQSLDDALEFLITHRQPVRRVSKVRVRLSRDKQTLRVDIPELDRLLPHLSELERFISTAFVIFEAELQQKLSDGKLSRHDVLRASLTQAGDEGQ